MYDGHAFQVIMPTIAQIELIKIVDSLYEKYGKWIQGMRGYSYAYKTINTEQSTSLFSKLVDILKQALSFFPFPQGFGCFCSYKDKNTVMAQIRLLIIRNLKQAS